MPVWITDPEFDVAVERPDGLWEVLTEDGDEYEAPFWSLAEAIAAIVSILEYRQEVTP